MKTILATCVALLALVAGVPAQQAAQQRFGFDEFSKVRKVSEPQFSPDGSAIAVVVSVPSLDEDRFVASIHRVDVATGRMQMVVDGATRVSVSFPRWSPDGSQIGFLAKAPTGAGQETQIFVVASQGGAPKQLTTAPEGVQQFAWSPDGRTIAFATQDEPEVKPGYQRFNDSFEVEINDHFLTEADLPPTHVWMVPSAGGDSKRLTSGTWTLPVARPPGPPSSLITWSPDGKSVVFARSGGGGGFGGGGLQAVNIADGSMSSINVNGTFPVYAPTGGMIAMIGGGASVAPVGPDGVAPVPTPTAPPAAAAGGGDPTVAGRGAGGRGAGAGRGAGGGGRGGRGGGASRSVTSGIDRGIARVLWMPDGKSVIVGGNDTERVSLWQQPVDGDPKKLDTGDASPNSSFFVDMAVSSKGAIAFAGTSPNRPPELYYMASPVAPARQLTRVNADLASMPLGRAEMITYTNDNLEQNGVLVYPPDFDPSKKYPLVLVIHGGPRAASLLTFDPRAQVMAARGWLVFSPNYRGSDNLGSAFQRGISGDAGAGPGRDVMAGIETIKKRGIVDETRIGVSGWSYGGYMTSWMIGNYPDVWKAAVAGAAVTDRIDQSTLGDGAGGRGGNNSPWVNPEVRQRELEQSPITYASKVKAPTLILANVGDYRVPIVQSYKLFHALRDSGVTTRFVAYPIFGHNATDPVRQRDVLERWVGWFDEHLK